jgi:circadian clock protein KaiC
MDTWLLLEVIKIGGERNRAVYVLKSRGMDHSNQIREFLISNDGCQLLDVYVGPDGVLTGSARLSQEEREKAEGTCRQQELDGHRRELERKRRILESRMVALQSEHEAEEERTQRSISELELLGETMLQDRARMVRSRKADTSNNHKENGVSAAGVR